MAPFDPTSPRDPHYLRFARALALVSGIATLPGCYLAHELGTDSGAPDARVADAGRDASEPCACTCSFTRVNPDPATCEGQGHFECCATLGPLPPPDLPA